jgi:hypothetical protein
VGRVCSATGRGFDGDCQHGGVILKPATGKGDDFVEDRSDQGLHVARAVTRDDAKKSIVLEFGA